jgi:glycolate oxidase FAD binding subunit
LGETLALGLEGIRRRLVEIVSEDFVELQGKVDTSENDEKIAVYPENEAEVVQVLKYAYEQGLSVITEGRGTKAGLGGMRGQADILLSLKRMSGIIEYSVGDLTMTALPGTLFSDIEEELNRNGQMFPLYPGWPSESTLGGTVSANISGVKRIRYGSARDWIIGLRVVYPDGTVIRTGGKVVKNVAGYDMTKLMIGSMGTLGVITEITVKLRPKPPHEELIHIYSKSIDPLHKIAQVILNSYMEPVALELLTPPLSRQLTGRSEYLLLVGFEDTKSSVTYQTEWLNGQASSLQLQLDRVLQGEDVSAWWEAYRKLSPKKNDSQIAIKVGSWMTEVAPIIETATQWADKLNVCARTHGGMGTGLTHMYIDAPSIGTDEQAVLRFIEEVRRYSEAKKGFAIVEHAPLGWRSKIDLWGARNSSFRLTEGIKNKIDPKGILNPGRFVGGL